MSGDLGDRHPLIDSKCVTIRVPSEIFGMANSSYGLTPRGKEAMHGTIMRSACAGLWSSGFLGLLPVGFWVAPDHLGSEVVGRSTDGENDCGHLHLHGELVKIVSISTRRSSSSASKDRDSDLFSMSVASESSVSVSAQLQCRRNIKMDIDCSVSLFTINL
jgi:hypothetical protein